MLVTLELTSLEIPDVKLVRIKRFGDERGFLSEVYSRSAFEERGVHIDFVQDNHSVSLTTGTVRGLHFQTPPFAQDKLVRVTRGRILDVAVDIRKASSTFGRHIAIELSAENWCQLLLPIGFAHGFCTLEPDSEVVYKVSAPYNSQCDAGILWSDPGLAISWPVHSGRAVISEKDKLLPRFRDMVSPF